MKTTSKRLPRDISDEYSKQKFQAGYLEQPKQLQPPTDPADSKGAVAARETGDPPKSYAYALFRAVNHQ